MILRGCIFVYILLLNFRRVTDFVIPTNENELLLELLLFVIDKNVKVLKN